MPGVCPGTSLRLPTCAVEVIDEVLRRRHVRQHTTHLKVGYIMQYRMQCRMQYSKQCSAVEQKNLQSSAMQFSADVRVGSTPHTCSAVSSEVQQLQCSTWSSTVYSSGQTCTEADGGSEQRGAVRHCSAVSSPVSLTHAAWCSTVPHYL